MKINTKKISSKILLLAIFPIIFALLFSLNTSNADAKYNQNMIESSIDILSSNTYISQIKKIDGPGLRSPSKNAYSGISDEKNLDQLIVNLTNFFLSFVTTVAVMALIYGGYLWIIDRGEDDMVEKAKKILSGAVIGILIIVSAYTLINTVLNYFTAQDQCDIALKTGNEFNAGIYCKTTIFNDDGEEILNFGIGGVIGDILGGFISW